MKDKVTRRDFLNGTQVAIGASLLGPWAEIFGADASKFALGPDYYPPAKTGLRGSHTGSWETMHARVAGATWPKVSPEEEFDLVIVGGGPVPPGSDPGAGIEDPWRRFDCAPDPAGCTLIFDDPEYAESPQDTVYYVKALEEPSLGLNGRPLETEFDAAGNPVRITPCTPDRVATGGCPAEVQERAWSSPIFIDAPTPTQEVFATASSPN